MTYVCVTFFFSRIHFKVIILSQQNKISMALILEAEEFLKLWIDAPLWSSSSSKQEAVEGEKKCSNFHRHHSSDDNYDGPGLIIESGSSFSQCQHETLSKNEFCLSLGR